MAYALEHPREPAGLLVSEPRPRGPSGAIVQGRTIVVPGAGPMAPVAYPYASFPGQTATPSHGHRRRRQPSHSFQRSHDAGHAFRRRLFRGVDGDFRLLRLLI